MEKLTKLSGWKAMARYLGRSERTVQLWETERALPVHRIPGVKGWTVYAYVEEIDAWMANDSLGADEKSPRADARDAGTVDREPGLLVLPFDWRVPPIDRWTANAFAEELIGRFAFHEPTMRVLSATTSRNLRQALPSTDALGRGLAVRYLVEGSVSGTDAAPLVDVRIVDAQRDRVLLASRFAPAQTPSSAFMGLVARAIVEHFSLVVAGALVEPRCLEAVDPRCFLRYLEGVRRFDEAGDDALRAARDALDDALRIEPRFAAAHALLGLVALQLAATGTLSVRQALETAQSAALCSRRAHDRDDSARLTAAFLDAAILLESCSEPERASRRWSDALLAMPASLASSGRLYERRSTIGPRVSNARSPERRRMPGGTAAVTAAALDDVIRADPANVFATVLRAMIDGRPPASASGSAPSDGMAGTRRSTLPRVGRHASERPPASDGAAPDDGRDGGAAGTRPAG